MPQEGQQPTSTPEEKAAPPPFEYWRPVVRAEDLVHIKRDLFEGQEIETREEQPHGIDLAVDKIVWVNKRHPGLSIEAGWLEATDAERRKFSYAKLEPDRQYFFLLSPLFKKDTEQFDFWFTLFPRSSLLRAGILAEPTTLLGTRLIEEYEGIERAAPAYGQGRQGAFKIIIKNPKGVIIEKGTPVAQLVLHRAPPGKQYPDKETADAFAEFIRQHIKEKSEPLHLGEVLQFGDTTPHLSKKQSRQKLDVTRPIAPSAEGKYLLTAGEPYLLRTQETVTLTNHELGITWGFPKEAERQEKGLPQQPGFGGALVDAGYRGKLIYLVVPKKDIQLTTGEKIGDLLRTNVPPTQKTYHGQWK